MNRKELIEPVRALRHQGQTPKQIARALSLPLATVTPLIRAIAAEDEANPPASEIIGCWVSSGWSTGLTVEGNFDWPEVNGSGPAGSGLVNVMAARSGRRGKVSVRGYLVDVYCLGVKDIVGPMTMDDYVLPVFTERYFSPGQLKPLEAPIELARQLVFGAVDYARTLGFEPPEQFAEAGDFLGEWTGPSAITFGHEGKPLYIQGPYDDAAQIAKTLERSAGQLSSRAVIVE